jgi:hypothetical protein
LNHSADFMIGIGEVGRIDLVWSKNSNALFSQCLRANHSQLLALQSTVL